MSHDSNMNPDIVSSLPFPKSERCFRIYEPHIRKAVTAWPQETQFPSSVMYDLLGNKYSPHTFAARMRDALSSLHHYNWETDIDLDKLRAMDGEYSVVYSDDGSVWWKAKGKQGRPPGSGPEARDRARARVAGKVTEVVTTEGDMVSRTWTNVKRNEVQALAVLLHYGRLVGPFALDFPNTPDLYADLESQCNVSHVYDPEKHKTVIT